LEISQYQARRLGLPKPVKIALKIAKDMVITVAFDCLYDDLVGKLSSIPFLKNLSVVERAKKAKSTLKGLILKGMDKFIDGLRRERRNLILRRRMSISGSICDGFKKIGRCIGKAAKGAVKGVAGAAVKFPAAGKKAAVAAAKVTAAAAKKAAAAAKKAAKAMAKGVVKAGGAVGKGVVKIGKATGKGVVKIGKAIGKGVVKIGKATGKGVVKIGKATGKGVVKIGKATGKGVVKIGKAIGKGVVKIGKAIGKGVVKIGKATGKGVVKAGKAIGKGEMTVKQLAKKLLPLVGVELAKALSKFGCPVLARVLHHGLDIALTS
jgi:hypothetical protein